MLAQRTHALLQRPLGPSPTQGDLTPTGSRGRRGGEIELNSTSKRALETWFPFQTAARYRERRQWKADIRQNPQAAAEVREDS